MLPRRRPHALKRFERLSTTIDLRIEALERQGADGAPAVVDELAVDLVGDQEEVVVAAERGDHLELLPAVDGAGGVVRVAEDDETRLRRDRAVPVGPGGEMESVLDPGPQRHQPDSRDRRERLVVRVERLDEQGLVPDVRAGEERECTASLPPVVAMIWSIASEIPARS